MAEGFKIPLHRSLTEPVLMGGSPRSLAILNGTIAAALGLGLRLWLAGLVYWVVAHGICVYAAKRDPNFIETLMRHIRHKGFLRC